MKNLTRNFAVALSVTLASVSGQAFAEDSSKPIVIPTHNWSSQVETSPQWSILIETCEDHLIHLSNCDKDGWYVLGIHMGASSSN